MLFIIYIKYNIEENIFRNIDDNFYAQFEAEIGGVNLNNSAINENAEEGEGKRITRFEAFLNSNSAKKCGANPWMTTAVFNFVNVLFLVILW